MSLEHATPAMPIQVIVYNVYITWAVGVGPFTFIHTTILTPTLFLSYCYLFIYLWFQYHSINIPWLGVGNTGTWK